MEPVAGSSVTVDCRLGEAMSTLADDVLDGLTRPFKEIPPKYFYDAYGSLLFERICELPEYYPTRTERAILERAADTIVAEAGAVELVELGSGYATKTRVLLDAMARAGTLRRYLPVDVSESTVRTVAADLVEEYPGLEVRGLIGDFEHDLAHLPAPSGPRLVAFLGGTIGNFPPGSRRRFLRGLAETLGADGTLLLGLDRVKDPAILEPAYDDGDGITAEFNRNVLRVINRELDGDFDVDAFEHVAFFDREREWIEMRLRSRDAQVVRLEALGLTVNLERGEEIRTEISAKFTRERIAGDFAAAGLALGGWYTDPDELFAVATATR